MKSKYLVILPVLGLGLLGAGLVSAHGLLTKATPEEIATRQQSMFEKKAEVLGVSVDQLKTYWAEGKTFKEIAELQGLTEEDLRTKMSEHRQAQMKEHLQILVQQGTITQEQANQRLTQMESRPQKSNFRGFGRGFGHHKNQEAQP